MPSTTVTRRSHTSSTRPKLSTRASATPSSAIRDLLDQAMRPGMISLAGGLPDARRFPVEALANIASEVLTANGMQILQYGPTRGGHDARDAMTALFDDGEHVDADDIAITTGSQQALDLLARVLLDPDDAVVVGDPDYLGALQVFRSNDAELCPIAIDERGLDTEQLEQRLQWGLRPKAVYIVPHFHNPTGSTMSAERRRHLSLLAARYGFVVIEDDPYRDLYFSHPHSPEVTCDPALTVRLRSTSKTLAPGLRVGAMAGPRWLIDAAITAKQSSDLHTSTVTQAIVAAALRSWWFDEHLDGLRSTYRDKRDVLVDALDAVFGESVFCTTPAGGMFVWANFVEVDDTAEWLTRCLDAGVCFVPGATFAVDRNLMSHARLSFATGSPDELRTAVDRMHTAL